MRHFFAFCIQNTASVQQILSNLETVFHVQKLNVCEIFSISTHAAYIERNQKIHILEITFEIVL
jgi:hypothetical protein